MGRCTKSFELRAFCWPGYGVGIGPYRVSESYRASAAELAAAASLAERAARCIGVPILIVDVAQTVLGKWIVIEVNDGQDSGYAGVAPLPMWRRLLDVAGEEVSIK
jgi:hypothetical protein